VSARPALKRREVYPGALVDGAPITGTPLGRLRRSVDRLLVSRAEREEAELERRIRTLPGVTRANTVAVISPKGGVGKTTTTFLVGNLLSTHLKLRTVAVDANPDFGTLASMAPDDLRAERSLADLLHDSERVATAAQVRPYVSRLPTGLYLLAAPRDAERMAELGHERYGELLAFLSAFYEVVLLDLGTGVADRLAQFAIERADQVILLTTPEWITSAVVERALGHLPPERTTVVVNKWRPSKAADADAIERRFRSERLHRSVALPYDERLGLMLDTGTYALEALVRPTRVPIKRVGLAVSEQLV
jgi:MinD-like ATPase involved in chromosome partitioning or flagellar assembly